MLTIMVCHYVLHTCVHSAHTYTHICLLILTPIISQTKRIFLLVNYEEDKQVVGLMELGLYPQLRRPTS